MNQTDHPTPLRSATGARARTTPSLDGRLAIVALLTYTATRLIGLAAFPIYFFTDEAANGVLAAEFLRNGFRDASGQFFPLYFQNGPSLSLSVSVYLQVMPTWLFGQSVFVTRVVPALITVTGVLACGLILKHIFKLRGWWLGILLLSITPAWFLHSRTAFEHAVWVSFYAWFVYFYLRYRTDKPSHLITAIVFGALTFYSYNGAQLGLVVMSVLLLIVDARYHWHALRRQRSVLIGLIVMIVCALPYVQFQLAHPDESTVHLQLLDSYWLEDIGLDQKIGRFAQEYLWGLRPDYWYAPDQPRDLSRHTMKGYGHELWITLPFAIIGLIIALKQLRQPGYRTLLIALLTSPLGGILAAATVQRDLVFVIPAALLTAIGLAAVLGRLTEYFSYQHLAVVICAALVVGNAAMLNDAVNNGPLWYRDYGLNGMQYGGPQVFTAIREHLEQQPRDEVWVFPTWLNGSDMLRRYFTPDDPRVQLLDFGGFLQDKFDVTEKVLLVLNQANYQQLIDSGKFAGIRLERSIALPDGSPGFYFIRARYSPEADALFAAARAARERLIHEGIILERQTVWIDYTPLSSGSIQNLFDHDLDTAILTRAINPAVIEIAFTQPRRLTGLALTTGSHDVDLLVELFADRATQAGRYATTLTRLRPNETVDVEFDPAPGGVRRIRIEVHDRNQSTTGSVTLREITLK